MSNGQMNLVVAVLVVATFAVAYLRAVLHEQDERDASALAAQLRRDRIDAIARGRRP